MSYQVPGFVLGTLTASADCSAKQHCFAKISGVNTVTFTAADTDVAIGVIQNKPASGEAVELMISGVSKVIASAAITAGANITSHTDGTAKAAASGDLVYGKALETAANPGDVIAVLLQPVNVVVLA